MGAILLLMLALGAFAHADEARARFLAERTPSWELSLADLPQFQVADELVRPESALPNSHQYPYAQITALFRYEKSCHSVEVRAVRDPTLAKALRWHQFRCGERDLPVNFFERAPFLHPGGSSYVVLALDLERQMFKGDWAKRHARYAHVLEMSHPALLPYATSQQAWLAQHGYQALSGITREQAVVEARPLVLLRVEDKSRLELRVVYRAFPLAEWTAYLEPTDYRWMLWILSSGLGLVVIGLLIQKGLAVRRDREARLFVLQMLAHELRTPAATLKFSVEAFRRHFDALPPDLQSEFLRWADEVQRLNRLVEASGQYLKSHRKAGVSFRYVEVPSLNDFVAEILADYDEGIEIQLLARDRVLRVDPYWMKVCLLNLVENARKHGRPPVSVRCRETSGGVAIDVVDQGTLHAVDSGAERGLGLGLLIVKRLVEAMRGKLEVREAPTTFSLYLRT